MAESILGGTRRARLLPLLGLALLMVVVLAGLAGCGANAADDPVMAAEVNGHSITLAQYQQMLGVYRAVNARSNTFTDWRQVSERNDLASTQRQVLDILINIELMREQLRQQHVTVSQADIQSARTTLNTTISTDREQLKKSPDAALRALLDALTPDVVDLLSEQNALQTALQAHGKIPAVHLRGIQAKDQAAAQKLQQQAESGIDFATLARANSQNSSTGSQGGEIGVIYPGTVSPQFDQEVFGPKSHPGKYVIVPIQESYWLFELSDLGPHSLSTITDAQTESSAVSSWLDEVVRPQASIKEYIILG